MTGALVFLLLATVVTVLASAGLGALVGPRLRRMRRRQVLPRIEYAHLTGEDVDWIEHHQRVAGVLPQCNEPRCPLTTLHGEHVMVSRGGHRLLRLEREGGSTQYMRLDKPAEPPNPGREVRS